MDDELQLEVFVSECGAMVVWAKGCLDRRTRTSLIELVTSTDRRVRSWHLDLSDLTFLDAGGCSGLVIAHQVLAARHVVMQLWGARGGVAKVLALTGVIGLFPPVELAPVRNLPTSLFAHTTPVRQAG